MTTHESLDREWRERLREPDPGTPVVRGGRTYDPIPYGQESYVAWAGVPTVLCGDCGCAPGGYHRRDCSFAECPGCGAQFIACGCLAAKGVGD